VLDDHASAVLALLEAAPNLTVYDGSVPQNTAGSYVVAYFSADTERSDRLTAQTTASLLRVTTHSVAPNPTAARRLADKVRTALLDVTPTVADWQSWPIRHDVGLPPQRDESTGKPVFDAIDAWTWQATPAGGA